MWQRVHRPIQPPNDVAVNNNETVSDEATDPYYIKQQYRVANDRVGVPTDGTTVNEAAKDKATDQCRLQSQRVRLPTMIHLTDEASNNEAMKPIQCCC